MIYIMDHHVCNWTHNMNEITKQRDKIQRKFDTLLKEHHKIKQENDRLKIIGV